MTLLAAFATLLHRYAGQDDIVIGTPTGNRDRPEIEKSMGFFLNTLALRVDLAGDPTFRELLAARPPHDPRRARAAGRALRDGGQRAPPASQRHAEPALPGDVHAGTAPRAARCAVVREHDGYRHPARRSSISPSNSTTRAKASTGVSNTARTCSTRPPCARMVGHYRTLLEGDRRRRRRSRLSALPLLTDAERRRTLIDWNATAAPYPRDRCFHRPLRRPGRRRPPTPSPPPATATSSPTARSTERANRLAHHLRARGVGPDAVVGLCLERSPRHARGVARRPQGGRRLPPPRSGLPPRPPRLHARGCPGPRPAHGAAPRPAACLRATPR